MAHPQLSVGAVPKLANGTSEGPLTLQVLGVKRMQNAQAQQDRYRLLLSDGEYSHSCMLATQLGELVSNDTLKENSIVTLLDYISNQVQNKKVVIVLNLTVVQSNAQKIGAPLLFDKVVAGGGGPPAAQPGFATAPANNGPGAYGAPPAVNPPVLYGGGAPPNPGANAYGGGGYGAPAAAAGYGAPNAPYGGHPAPVQQQCAPANPYGQPGQQFRGAGPVARNEAPAGIMPINALNSYQNRWTIKARVTNKSEIRRYSNARGEGKFFSFDLLDAAGGEIRVVCWNDQCDRWEPVIEQGKVYMISKASLRNKRGNFNQTRHAFEIHLENSSVVELCNEEDDIPHMFFSFIKIGAVEDSPPGSMVDICGVVESVMDWTTITKRDGTDTQKRSVTLRDDTQRSIELTLWGKYANEPGDQLYNAHQAGLHPIVAVKSARVGDFNGKTLSTVGSSTVVIDPPEVPEAIQLRQWYDSGGATMAAEALSKPGGGRSDRRLTLAQIKDENLGMGDKPDWVQVAGAITFLRTENMYYPACSNKTAEGRQCNKKLHDNGDATWSCERCGGNFEPEFRYMLNFQLSDHTGEAWVTAFQEQGVEIMGRSAAEIKDMRDSLGENEFSAYMQDLNFRHYLMKLKITNETYNDETKLRTSVVTVAPPNFVTEGKVLLDMIGKLERGEPVYARPQPQGGQQQQQQYGGGAAGYGGGAYGAVGGYKQQTPPHQAQGGPGGYNGQAGQSAGYANQNQNQQLAGTGGQDRFW